jgi:hypothetical protein
MDTKKVSRANFLLVICFVLILLNGFQYKTGFKVDFITIGLIVLSFIPTLQQMLVSFKGGGVEVEFREYTVHKQMFIFLDGIASKQTWTFYTPRKDEIALGQGIKVLIDELLLNKKKDLIRQLKRWLQNENFNQKWFAAEVIGYAKIDELKSACKSSFENLDIDEYWELWQLNCLWAYSRFFEYEPLISKFQKSKNDSNLIWMAGACKQMIQEEETDRVKLKLEKVLKDFYQQRGSFSTDDI